MLTSLKLHRRIRHGAHNGMFPVDKRQTEMGEAINSYINARPFLDLCFIELRLSKTASNLVYAVF